MLPCLRHGPCSCPFPCNTQYVRRRSVVGASTGAGSDKENINGIVQGHAYSVVAAKEVDNFKLVKLRNPWCVKAWMLTLYKRWDQRDLSSSQGKDGLS